MDKKLPPGQGQHIGVRHGRMMREVGDFGFDTQLMLEAAKLGAAALIGALIAIWMIGHSESIAKVPAASPQVFAPAPGTALEGSAQRDAPQVDTPQRDVHSDGGGH